MMRAYFTMRLFGAAFFIFMSLDFAEAQVYSGHGSITIHDATGYEQGAIQSGLRTLQYSDFWFRVKAHNSWYTYLGAYTSTVQSARKLKVVPWLGSFWMFTDTYWGADIKISRGQFYQFASRPIMASFLYHEASHHRAGSHTCGPSQDASDDGIYGIQAHYLAKLKNQPNHLNLSEKWTASAAASRIAYYKMCGNRGATSRIINQIYAPTGAQGGY